MQSCPSLWQFSLKFYQDNGVSQACLMLQDSFGVDVNILLYLMWQAGRGVELNFEQIRAVDEFVADWRDNIVRPLRGTRRHLKEMAAKMDEVHRFRQDIKRIELAAEHIQQDMLEKKYANFGLSVSSEKLPEHSARIAAAHLAYYSKLLRCTFPHDEVLISRLVEIRSMF